MEKITYSTELINQVLSYLGTRPFNEVAGLITELQKGELSKEEETKEETNEQN
jgi:hypothetical protein